MTHTYSCWQQHLHQDRKEAVDPPEALCQLKRRCSFMAKQDDLEMMGFVQMVVLPTYFNCFSSNVHRPGEK